MDIVWDQPVRSSAGHLFGSGAALEFMMAMEPDQQDDEFADVAEALVAATKGRLSSNLAQEMFESPSQIFRITRA